MVIDALSPFFAELLARGLPDGSFAAAPGAMSRPDATAWAAMALHASGLAPDVVATARKSLADLQLPDGSVPILSDCPTAGWPTPLGILAWLPDPALFPRAKAAAAWLLSHTGCCWSRESRGFEVIGHDPSLKGWPRIVDTHSWVEPTALAMLALTAMGQAGSIVPLAEATMLLLDRELPDGGWNYGNTRVFHNILLPIPDSTGHALTALAAFPIRPERTAVANSLDYLASPKCASRTPLVATWRAFGLTAWGEASPAILDDLIITLARQDHYGPYDTALLAQLLAAAATCGNFCALSNNG